MWMIPFTIILCKCILCKSDMNLVYQHGHSGIKCSIWDQSFICSYLTWEYLKNQEEYIFAPCCALHRTISRTGGTLSTLFPPYLLTLPACGRPIKRKHQFLFLPSWNSNKHQQYVFHNVLFVWWNTWLNWDALGHHLIDGPCYLPCCFCYSFARHWLSFIHRC